MLGGDGHDGWGGVAGLSGNGSDGPGSRVFEDGPGVAGLGVLVVCGIVGLLGGDGVVEVDVAGGTVVVGGGVLGEEGDVGFDMAGGLEIVAGLPDV